MTRRFTKVFLPVLELHREPVVRPESVHVLERVVRAAAVRVEEPRQEVVELIRVGKMTCRLASLVLMVRIGTLLDQEFRDLDVAVLRGDVQHGVTVFVHLIEIERLTFVGIDVGGTKVLDIRHLDDGRVELFLCDGRERVLEARDLAVAHQRHDLVKVERLFLLLRGRLVALGGTRLRVLVQGRRAGGGDTGLAGLHEDAHLLVAFLFACPEFRCHIQNLLPV